MAVKLKAEKRNSLKKSYTRELREAGNIPAVVYGKDKEPITVAIDSMELLKTVRDEGKNAIISLDVKGDSVDVMLHDYQVDPLKDQLLHADFYIVNMSEARDVDVPIHLDGEAPGAKEGGVLQQPLYELQISAKPGQIPEAITIDVSRLEIGDTINVSDLPESGTYEILTDPETTVVTVTAPTTNDDVEGTEELDPDSVEAIEEGTKNDNDTDGNNS